MQNSQAKFDVVIVGGGIVGAVLAVSLKSSGLKIAIVETQPLDVVTKRQRAYAMSLLSQKIFKGLGIWDEVSAGSGKYCQIQLSDENFSGKVRFNGPDLKSEYLGFSGQHGVMLSALQKQLAGNKNIQWFAPATVMGTENRGDRTFVSIQTEADGLVEVETSLVVGADGGRSPIRQAAGIKTKGWKYWQSCITFVVEHQTPRNDIAFERFWGSGPMGVLPLPGNRCQIVWTNPTEEAQRLQALDKESFVDHLQSYVKPLGRVKLVGDRLVFPVKLMQSDRYVKERLALVGDAAHSCHPVGGQGLNQGIRDAASLAQVLKEAHVRGEDVGNIRVLKRYERWRKFENLIILSFTDLLNRMFSNRFLPIVAIRRLGLLVMARIRPLRLFALKLMAGQKGKQPKVALVRD